MTRSRLSKFISIDQSWYAFICECTRDNDTAFCPPVREPNG